MAGLPWADMGRNEMDADHDPADLFRMPLCRFVAVRLPPDKAVLLAAINKDRAALGFEPLQSLE